MNVGELIVELQKHDLSKLVVKSGDDEGNFFNTVDEVAGNSVYNREDREVRLEELTPELRAKGYAEEDTGNGEPAVVLW